jgi:hypothetical protein
MAKVSSGELVRGKNRGFAAGMDDAEKYAGVFIAGRVRVLKADAEAADADDFDRGYLEGYREAVGAVAR